jgi:hypothetical protein
LNVDHCSEFCGGPRYFEQYVWGLVPAIKIRKIKLCGLPLRINGELRIHKNYLELEVDELSTPSAAEVAGLLKVDVSSTLYSRLESFLRDEPLLPDAIGYPYLIGQYDGVDLVNPVVSYRITDHSLEYLFDQLLEWNTEDLIFRCQHPPESLQGYLDSLLLAYSQRQTPFSTVSNVCELLFGTCSNY